MYEATTTLIGMASALVHSMLICNCNRMNLVSPTT